MGRVGGEPDSRTKGAVLLAVTVGCLLAACRGGTAVPAVHDRWSPLPAPDLGEVVGRVAEIPIFAGEVTAEMARSGCGAREAFDRLAELTLLAERARGQRRPLPEPPPALLVQRLLERDFEPVTTPARIPDEDLRRAYQQVRDHYVHPRLVEVALLSVYTGPGMKPEPRARAQQTARDLGEELRQRPRLTAEEAQALARAPEWKSRKVVFWRFWQGPDRESGPFGGKVAPAIARLQRPRETSGLIEDESGFHFALYLGERPPRNVTFEQAREELRERAFPEWRRYRFEELVKAVRGQHRVEIHHQRVLSAAPPP